MPLLNDFLVGADPEFIILENGHMKQFTGRGDVYAPWGLDHGRWVIEPHPKPDMSVRQLIQHLKSSFNDFATVAPSGKWRAGAHFSSPERSITLGGHVHIDRPTCTPAQRDGLDLFTRHLEALDILPQTECVERRKSSYGQYGDVRCEHGHFEYRTLASWLFSQRVTKLCLIGAKLIMVDPEAPRAALGAPAQAAVPKLKAFFERFQNRDEDVDWILGAGVLGRKLNVKPDRDLRDVWKVEPVKENPRWKEEKARLAPPPQPQVRRNIVYNVPERRPYIFEVEGYYVSFRVGVDRIPTQDQLEAIRENCRRRTAALVVGDWQPGRDSLFVWGILGQSWGSISIPNKIIRTTVDGTRYKWMVIENWEIDDRVREILRNYVHEGNTTATNQVVLREGLLFQPLGPQGEHD